MSVYAPSDDASGNGDGEDFFDFVGGSSGPPPGDYVARLEGIKSTTHTEWGKGVRFSCEVVEGESSGCRSDRTGKPDLTSQNISGTLVSGILGRPWKPKESMNLRKYVGCKYLIKVTHRRDQTKGTMLASISRLPGENYPD